MEDGGWKMPIWHRQVSTAQVPGMRLLAMTDSWR
jgi:hypothetical protein